MENLFLTINEETFIFDMKGMGVHYNVLLLEKRIEDIFKTIDEKDICSIIKNSNDIDDMREEFIKLFHTEKYENTPYLNQAFIINIFLTLRCASGDKTYNQVFECFNKTIDQYAELREYLMAKVETLIYDYANSMDEEIDDYKIPLITKDVVQSIIWSPQAFSTFDEDEVNAIIQSNIIVIFGIYKALS